MPRGKNYVNQNKGMSLIGRQRVTEPCKYGAACTRKDCIYNHELVGENATENAPCMAYLAGMCTFSKGCRRRHPPDDECERLVAKYAKLPCRYGPNCHTEGCLYNHDRTVPTKPTPPVSKAAPLAAWMPTGCSSIPEPPPATTAPVNYPSYQQRGGVPPFQPQLSYPPYYQGGPQSQAYPGPGYPGQPMMQDCAQSQPFFPPQPNTTIGSWKPAPIATSPYQPYSVPQAAQPPPSSWESQFPELQSTPKEKNDNDKLGELR